MFIFVIINESIHSLRFLGYRIDWGHIHIQFQSCPGRITSEKYMASLYSDLNIRSIVSVAAGGKLHHSG